ncbi:MAG: alpha-galactosidase [Anaerolineae bacterium]|nr:alpha-galactosidase [Anaerolineae bacterium]
MTTATVGEQRWADVHLVMEPVPVISYRTALTVYEESIMGGRFVGRGWNASGHINYYDPDALRFNPNKHPTPQAFWLEVDGQLLASHWEWKGLEKQDVERGLHAVVTLEHKVRPVTVRVHTLLDGTSVIVRWLEVTNRGTQPASLSAVYPWSGVLQSTPRWRAHLPDKNAPLYSVGYMANHHWGDEGNFQWQPLPSAGYRVDGRFRRNRHRHPMFILVNNATGEYFNGQLAWSGGYSFEFDLDADLGTTDGAARLFFRAGLDAPAPLRIIAPGETVATPEVHLGLTTGDLDTSINAMHDHLRASVLMPPSRGRGGWVEGAIGPEQPFTLENVYYEMDTAAAVGCEVYFLDAGYYVTDQNDWWPTVGDWQIDPVHFPQGLKPVRDRAHEKGMLFGLWMDAERIGSKSRTAQEHPEWWAVEYDGVGHSWNVLDLTQPVVARWMEDQIVRLITENELDFFRLDYNAAAMTPGYWTSRDGFVENSAWRYYEALYAIYKRLRARFPNVIFENCAGGGGRTDLGLVRHFDHTWTSDWSIAGRHFSITNGMTMALPPPLVDRQYGGGGAGGYMSSDGDYRARMCLFGRPTIGWVGPAGTARNPLLVAQVRHMADLYKKFVRPFLNDGRIYHHTPTFDGPEPQGWGVLELASRDRARGIAGVFQLSSPRGPEYLLRLRGLDASRRYQVTWDNSGQVSEVDGFVLMKQGIVIRLEGALTSELLIFEAV